MANFSGTPGDDFFTLVGAPNPGNTYFDFGGDDTYLVTPFTLPAGTIANIADNKGNNTLQLNDGLQIASSNFSADAVQLILNNGAKVIITQGASTNFKYQVGANFTINDTAPSQTFNQFATILGASSVPGSGGAYTVPTGFSILATVEFASTTFSAQEGNSGVKVFQIPVTIFPPQPNSVTFKATTTALSATDFLDFTPFTNKTITIPANTASTTIDLDVVTDTVPEPDEDLKITISAPSAGIAIGSKNVVTVTILNDDANQPPTITPATATATAPSSLPFPLFVDFTTTDPDNAILNFEISGSNGLVRLDDPSNFLSYVGYTQGTNASVIKGSGAPANLSTILDSLKYTSASSAGSTDTVTIKVNDGVNPDVISTITVNITPNLILTTGNQNLVGTAGNDLFLSDPALGATDANRLVQGGDTLNGAGGNDTLSLDAANITGPQALVIAPATQVQSIKNLVIKSDNTAPQSYTLDAANVNGLQNILWQGDSGDDLTITNLKPAITTTLTKSIDTLSLKNTAPNLVNLVLDGGVKIDNLNTLANVNKVNLESKGTGTNKVIDTPTVSIPTDYVITGSANLELDTAAPGLDPNIENLNASAFTGNLNTTIGNIGSGGSFKGGSGSDTIDGSLVALTNLTLIGNAGSDSLIGGGGDDTIDGGAGNDTLDGGAGNDSLVGGDGDDSLFAGAGTDFLDGGKGFDVIVLAAGPDTIKLRVGDGGSGLQSITDTNTIVDDGDIFKFAGKIDIITSFDTTTDQIDVVNATGVDLNNSGYGATLTAGKGYFIRGEYDDANAKFTVANSTGTDYLIVVGDGVPLSGYTTASYFILSNFSGGPLPPGAFV